MKFFELQQKIRYFFRDISLLEKALTHSSFVNENYGAISYERLEFLGDAVINFIVADYLFLNFKNYSEGELTKFRSRIVNGEQLAIFARTLSLSEYIKLGKGEQIAKRNEQAGVLADVFEALIAAVYVDGGLHVARGILLEIIKDTIDELVFIDRDYKSRLQELAQAKFKVSPEYKTVGFYDFGPMGDFEVEVYINGKLYGKGVGKSKKEASIKAAQQAFELLSRTDV